MDGSRFDTLARILAQRQSRRSAIRGALGAAGGLTALAVGGIPTEAAWSTLVCLPDETGGYLQRLVPTAAVPYYVRRYAAVLAENGVCPPRTCPQACAGTGCQYCMDLQRGGTACSGGSDYVVAHDCATPCDSDAECPADFPTCVTAWYQNGEEYLPCPPTDKLGYCGFFTVCPA